MISLVEVETRLSSSLSVQQTPSRPQTETSKKPRIVAKRNGAIKSIKKQVSESSKPNITTVYRSTKPLKDTGSFFPNSVRYFVTDGYCYRSQFWETVRELNLDFIGKLRVDADLRYLYTGEKTTGNTAVNIMVNLTATI